jgi:hypothetical protein
VTTAETPSPMSESFIPAEPDTCAICGKSTANGRGYMRLREGDRLVELCCPMCLKVYQERKAKREEEERSGDKYIGWDEK